MRRFLFIAAFLALPLLLIACRGDSASSIIPGEALRGASERVAEEKTFKFEFSASFSAADDSDDFFGSLFGDLTLKGEGAVDIENERTYIKMDIIFMEMEFIQIGSECYVRSNWFGDLWQRDPDCSDDTFEDDFFFGDDPAAVFDMFRELADDIEDLGEDTVRGVKARHYRVIVHDPEVDLTGDGVPVEIWLDDRGRPVKFRFEMDESNDPELAGESIALEFYFFDWGQPVDIQAPPEDKIGEADFFGGFGDDWDDWDDDWDWEWDDDWDWPWDDDDDWPWGSD